MHTIKTIVIKIFAVLALYCYPVNLAAQQSSFKVVGFYTAKNDLAHISFVHEANQWFSKMGRQYHFSYDSTNNWNNMNTALLSKYQVVLFLDTRPDSLPQRKAFEQYMKNVPISSYPLHLVSHAKPAYRGCIAVVRY